MQLKQYNVCYLHTCHSQKQRQVEFLPLCSLSQDATKTLEVQETEGHLFHQSVHLWHLHMGQTMQQQPFFYLPLLLGGGGGNKSRNFSFWCYVTFGA